METWRVDSVTWWRGFATIRANKRIKGTKSDLTGGLCDMVEGFMNTKDQLLTPGAKLIRGTKLLIEDVWSPTNVV